MTMIKTSSNLQELKRQIYLKAKSDKTHRFWGIFVHIAKMETLKEAYCSAKRNDGAPGVDGQTFKAIEAQGVNQFLSEIQKELLTRTYKPRATRPVEIPKGNGKTRTLQIPCIRDRVVQGALKIILEAIFEADFCSNSYGFRPRRSQHLALAEVRRSILRRMSTVIDVDLSQYFDTIRHTILLNKIACRIQDNDVMHLIKQIIKLNGKIGIAQGGPFSPLAANIYLNSIDWYFDNIRQRTAQNEGGYEAINYHRYADDMVITVSGHHTKRGWAELALQRLQEQLTTLGVQVNKEKTKMVNLLAGESFGFLGFDLRYICNRKRTKNFVLIIPKKKARLAVKAEIKKLIMMNGATPVKEIVEKINVKLKGWVNYFRVGNSSRAFSEIRNYVEMKVRTLLTRRKCRRKRSMGWQKWSNEYIYGGLKLFWDWKLNPLKPVEAYHESNCLTIRHITF